MNELGAAVRAAKSSGKILLDNYGKVGAYFKKDKSMVTEIDIASEKNIKSILFKEFPEYSFLGEETGFDSKKSEYKWIVDPLDGTTNYSMKNPFFNVSIGLVKGKTPVLGAVYSPAQDELFTAELDGGAYLNGKRIAASESDFAESINTFCHGKSEADIRRAAELFLKFKLLNPHFRQIGAAALELCYVACGRIGSFLMAGVNSWDVAAGAVIAKEAGAQISDFNGNEFAIGSKTLIASNRKIHKRVLEIINHD